MSSPVSKPTYLQVALFFTLLLAVVAFFILGSWLTRRLPDRFQYSLGIGNFLFLWAAVAIKDLLSSGPGHQGRNPSSSRLFVNLATVGVTIWAVVQVAESGHVLSHMLNAGLVNSLALVCFMPVFWFWRFVYGTPQASDLAP